ncbi:MAG: beta-lactamase family protein [Ferruginibacter sp.]|nr:beta-lactamase family protein [Ferruginibacter sp.]
MKKINDPGKAILLFLLAALTPPAVRAQDIQRIDGSTISTASLRNNIERLLQKANVSGLCISVFNNNEPVFTQAFGLANVPLKTPLTTSTVLYGASFSKAVFGWIVMQLVQEKKIDLDKPLVAYLSKPLVDYTIPGWNRGYQQLVNDDRYKMITGRMCLNHTTGFPNWRWFEGDKKLKIKFTPGTRYSYSGEGIYLLQFVIEQITRKDYESIAQERAFKPLHMINTSYVWQPGYNNKTAVGHNSRGEPYEFFKWKEASAGGSMCTTLDDYTKFFTALMQQKLLNKPVFNEMISTQVRIRSRQQFGPNALADTNENDPIQLGYGLGFGVMHTSFGRAFFKEGHDDGWGHYSIGFPDKGIAIIMMTNNDNGESIFKELLATAIGDSFTPWYWENYIPYDQK